MQVIIKKYIKHLLLFVYAVRNRIIIIMQFETKNNYFCFKMYNKNNKC